MTLDGERTDFGALPPTVCTTPTGQAPCYRVMLPPVAPGGHSVEVSAYTPAGESSAPAGAIDEPDRVVYIRLWTKLNGVWRYSDSRFAVSDLAAQFVYPIAGAVDVDITKPLRWNAIAGADAYSLAVGRTLGSSELLNVTDLTKTSYTIATLPGYEILYARLGTKVQGVWRYRDAKFAAMPATALLRAPADGLAGVPTTTSFWWTSVPGVQSYYLYVGRTPGAKDVVNSGEIRDTSYEVKGMPEMTPLYVRLWTKLNGTWRYVDSSFTSGVPPPIVTAPPQVSQPDPADPGRFLSPRHGEVVAGGTITFNWTASTGAAGYHLSLGTAPGADDVARSADVQTETQFVVSGIPNGMTLYARLYTKATAADLGRYVDVVFTTESPTPPRVCPCSLWKPTVVPIKVEESDSRPVTIGVRFKPDRSGYITGIRFYKGVNNIGTHVGTLWTIDGALLATVTFTGETASGWQQAKFSTPVPVTAGAVYVAAYFAPVGRYSEDDWYFGTAFANAPLRTADAAGGVSVYFYGPATGFPNQLFRSANYWVDVIYEDSVAITAPVSGGGAQAAGPSTDTPR